MSEQTHIQWCDATFNPWIGCTKVSPGCAHCYAEEQTPTRVNGIKWGKGQARYRTSEANWRKPRCWNRRFNVSRFNDSTIQRPRVFCASLADWLDDEVPIEWLADLLKLIHDTPNLDWLLLTKRPQKFVERMDWAQRFLRHERFDLPAGNWLVRWLNYTAVPHNVWFGVSVEDQVRAEERIPVLLKIPARIRFLSCEPLLGPIDLLALLTVDSIDSIHWVIIGGESGPRGRCRPCHLEQVDFLCGQCLVAGIRCFVKQLGSNTHFDNANWFDWPDDAVLKTGGCHEGFAAGCVQWKHPKGGDMAEWPEQLRVREFPVPTKHTK